MHQLFDFLRLFFGLFCWLFVWCLAFWRGRWPERMAAGVTLILGIFTAVFRQTTERGGAFSLQSFTTDSLLFLTFLFLALRSHRIWPIAAAGFQMIAVLTHIVTLIKNPGSTWSYLGVSVLATWLVLVAFAAGLWENEVRRRMERDAIIDGSAGDQAERLTPRSHI